MALRLVLALPEARRGGCRWPACRGVRRRAAAAAAAPAAESASSSKAPVSRRVDKAGGADSAATCCSFFFDWERVRGGDDAILLDPKWREIERKGGREQAVLYKPSRVSQVNQRSKGS